MFFNLICVLFFVSGLAVSPPANWPYNTLELGRDENGISASIEKNNFKLRALSLPGKLNNDSSNWVNYNSPPLGNYVYQFAQDSYDNDRVPIFVYFCIQATGDYNNDNLFATMNNKTTMKSFYDNVIFFFQKANGTKPAILDLEPNLWSYLQITKYPTMSTNISVSVNSSGHPSVSTFPNNLSGFARSLMYLRDTYAKNVLLAYHIQTWGAGYDIFYGQATTVQAITVANTAAAFMKSTGASNTFAFDLILTEVGYVSSGYEQPLGTDKKPCAANRAGCNGWWGNTTDFANLALFIDKLTTLLNRSCVVGSIPIGNAVMRTCDNSPGHYQSNQVEYFLGDSSLDGLKLYAKSGVIALAFYESDEGTQDRDYRGDEITNPPAINNNTVVSASVDDDGGYLKIRASAYASNKVFLNGTSVITSSVTTSKLTSGYVSSTSSETPATATTSSTSDQSSTSTTSMSNTGTTSNSSTSSSTSNPTNSSSSTSQSSTTDSTIVSGGQKSTPISYVIIGAACGGALLILIVIIIVVLIVRKKRSKREDNEKSSNNVEMEVAPPSGYSTMERNGSTYSTMPRKNDEQAASYHGSLNQKREKDKYEIRYSELEIGPTIGSGHFGRVFKATWRNMDCAVKELLNVGVSKDEVQNFIDELSLMKMMQQHKNVVQFLGYCDEPRLCIVTEFCKMGSMQSLLDKHDFQVTPDLARRWIIDIANGMLHLSLEGIIHKDLAARNILVSDHELTAKVSDFGLSRLNNNEQQQVYLSKSDIGPIKWMAPESISSRVFSQSSDVWSFGITCIEILTRQRPYPSVQLDQFLYDMKGYHEKITNYIPKNTPNDLRNMITQCLQINSQARPSFKEICSKLR